jgi:hypothetical protein
MSDTIDTGPVLGRGSGVSLERMMEYALAQTYRIRSANRNRRAAKCWGCGERLGADTGYEVHQEGWYVGRSQVRYLCRGCFRGVRAACEKWGGALPEWWKELDRPGRGKGEERGVMPRPTGAELDELIREREEEREGEGKR